jgi:hypothetical protein
MTYEVKFLIGVQIETATPPVRRLPPNEINEDDGGITGGSFCSPRRGIAFAISVF